MSSIRPSGPSIVEHTGVDDSIQLVLLGFGLAVAVVAVLVSEASIEAETTS